MRRPLLLILFALLAAPGAAQATTVGSPYGSGVQVFDPDAIANGITVSRSGDELEITDALGPLTASAPCTQLTPATVRCPATGTLSIGGGGGDDAITVQGSLGLGQNFITGGDGDDVIRGGADRDTMSGNDGADQIFGGDGQDELDGGHGDDRLEGEGGPDSFFGGDGDHMLPLGESGGGDDVIRGGADSDSITYMGTSGVHVTLAGGADDGHAGERDDVQVEHVTGTEGPDVLIGSDQADFLAGREGDDVLDGAGGSDELQGGDGADTITGGAGADRLTGGVGPDRLDCGADRDQVELPNPDDSIDVSCEDGLPPAPPVITPAPVATVGAGGAVAELRRRRMSLRLTCTGAGTCSGAVRIVFGKRRLASVTYAVPAGTTKTLRLALGASARKALKKRRSVKVAVTGSPVARTLRLRIR